MCIFQSRLSINFEGYQILKVSRMLLKQIENTGLIEVNHEQIELFGIAQIITSWEKLILIHTRESYSIQIPRQSGLSGELPSLWKVVTKLVGEQFLGINFRITIIPMNIEHATALHRILNPNTPIFITFSLSCFLKIRISANTRKDNLVKWSLDFLLPANPIFICLLFWK